MLFSEHCSNENFLSIKKNVTNAPKNLPIIFFNAQIALSGFAEAHPELKDELIILQKLFTEFFANKPTNYFSRLIATEIAGLTKIEAQALKVFKKLNAQLRKDCKKSKFKNNSLHKVTQEFQAALESILNKKSEPKFSAQLWQKINRNRIQFSAAVTLIGLILFGAWKKLLLYLDKKKMFDSHVATNLPLGESCPSPSPRRPAPRPVEALLQQQSKKVGPGGASAEQSLSQGPWSLPDLEGDRWSVRRVLLNRPIAGRQPTPGIKITYSDASDLQKMEECANAKQYYAALKKIISDMGGEDLTPEVGRLALTKSFLMKAKEAAELTVQNAKGEFERTSAESRLKRIQNSLTKITTELERKCDEVVQDETNNRGTSFEDARAGMQSFVAMFTLWDNWVEVVAPEAPLALDLESN